MSFRIEGRPVPASQSEEMVTWYRLVSAGYFEAMGTRVVAGRVYSEADNRNDYFGIVVDDLLINDDPHLLRFATTQTYVRVGDRWYYLTGHTAPIDDQ